LHRAGKLTPVQHGRYLVENITAARDVELERVDHAPVAGDTDAIVDEIRAFPTGVLERPGPDRVLATVLFTDIVGSTERAATLGPKGWRQAKRKLTNKRYA